MSVKQSPTRCEIASLAKKLVRNDNPQPSQNLMLEVLAKPVSPYRGNKVHVTYFPVMAKTLSALIGDNKGKGNKFIPDFRIIGEK